MFDWTEEELSLLGWQWAGEAMRACEQRPELWRSWVEHVRKTIDPSKTTDSKMGVALTEYVNAFLLGENNGN